MDNIEKLKFPIGSFVSPTDYSNKSLSNHISEIENFPSKIEGELNGLKEDELNWVYRPDGWNIRQIIHHCADSHMNSFIRFKLALTENKPIIKPYLEAEWAKLTDYNQQVETSLNILYGLHKRWCQLLTNLTDEQLNKSFIHPEYNKEIKLKENIALYAWHCNHHLEHIKLAKRFKTKYCY